MSNTFNHRVEELKKFLDKMKFVLKCLVFDLLFPISLIKASIRYAKNDLMGFHFDTQIWVAN